MKRINSDFISGFIKRGGFSVFFSTALVKISAALLSIIVVQLLTKEDYGILSYVLSIYAIAIVIAGFGGNYSLLRFGSIVNSFLKKKTVLLLYPKDRNKVYFGCCCYYSSLFLLST